MPTEVQIYKDGTVVAADIAADAVETEKIKDGNVTSAKLEADSNGKGKRTVSTLQPSSASGINGDIWYVVEAASSSSSIVSNATQVTGPDNVDTADLVNGTMAQTDRFRIRISADPDQQTGATVDNGFAEIATANEGNEPIYVRQYTSTGSGSGINYFANITRTATLLDRNGNTTFPGTVTATTFNGNLTGTASTATTALGFSTTASINTTGIITATSFAKSGGTSSQYLMADGSTTDVFFAKDTTLVFYQATAPIGWTRLDTQDNKALRVVSGTGSAGGGQGSSTGGTSGGKTNNTFTSIFSSSRTVPLVDHSHGITDPGHFHTSKLYNGLGSGFAGGGGQGERGNINTGSNTTGITVNAASDGTNAGGTQSTGNTMDFEVQYIDVILCKKN